MYTLCMGIPKGLWLFCSPKEMLLKAGNGAFSNELLRQLNLSEKWTQKHALKCRLHIGFCPVDHLNGMRKKPVVEST